MSSSPVKNTFRPRLHSNQLMDSLTTSGWGVHCGVGMNFIPIPRLDVAAVGSDLPSVMLWNVLFVEW